MITNDMTSKQMLDQLMRDHYDGAMEAAKNGAMVCWSTSIAPQELLEVFDNLVVVYPENQCAAIGARRDALGFIQKAEDKGYSADICSYARVNMGYCDIKESIAENIPMPDFLFCCNNICNTVIKWYENLSKELNIPMVMIDVPYSPDMDQSQERIEYVADQFKAAISELEVITGQKFDEKKFEEIMKISNITAKWWGQGVDYTEHIPSPINGFDLFNYMAMAVCMRGKPEGQIMFKKWCEESEAKIAAGKGPWKDQEEKFRVLWDGIACWTHLSFTYKTLKKLGINICASTYPDGWIIKYDIGDFEGMARAYNDKFTDRPLEYKVKKLVDMIEKYHLDGAILHSNRSCKLMDFTIYEVQRRVEEITGKPVVIFDGDQTDPRVFSEAQFETRMQAFAEMMEKNKAK